MILKALNSLGLRTIKLGLVVAVLFACTPIFAANKARNLKSFELKDYHGKTYSLEDSAGKVVVLAFLGTECPLAKLYGPRLEEIAKKYGDKGAVFLGVCPNQQDSVSELASYARVHGISFPLLKDLGNVVADEVGVTRVPEVVVLDRDRTIRYRGRVDDQFGLKDSGGYSRPKGVTKFLENALDEVLSNRSVSIPETQSIGCLIGRVRDAKPGASVTYTKHIAGILNKHCNECHRTGEIAPFALTSYTEVAGWADMINEVVKEQRMPPWQASPAHGKWRKDRRLSDDEKKLISDWVANGAPEGNASDLPAPTKYTEGWAISKPDKVIEITAEPVKLPASGTIEYKYFTVDPGFKEDVWVKAADCRVSNRSVVHHIIAFVLPPGKQAKFKGGEPMNAWLLHGYAPGMPALELPEGMAAFIPAGSKFVFQMHYTANGSPAEDKSWMGLVFADAKEIKHNIRTEPALNMSFVIPPGADNHQVDSFASFHRDTILVSLMPHLHLRGKAFTYKLEYPDGREETLLDIPKYDFNWQNTYYFANPKRVPAGSRLHCIAHYDNSDSNLANPDPKAWVRWGDQTWEEMMIGWYTFTTDLADDSNSTSRTERFEKMPSAQRDKFQAKAIRIAKRALSSEATFELFAHATSLCLPQVDRICVSKLDGEKLNFVRVHQSPVYNSVMGDARTSIPANNSALVSYLKSNEQAIVGHLDTSDQGDLKRMGTAMKSSIHVPITVGGERMLVSFWSREPKAFSESAKAMLTEIGQHVSKATKSAAE